LKVFELLTGRWLFHPRAGKAWTAEAYHLAHMGPLVESEFDPAIVGKGSKFNDYFDEEGLKLLVSDEASKLIEIIAR
jgi:serine/threonine-protein kinase SRPK3